MLTEQEFYIKKINALQKKLNTFKFYKLNNVEDLEKRFQQLQREVLRASSNDQENKKDIVDHLILEFENLVEDFECNYHVEMYSNLLSDLYQKCSQNNVLEVFNKLDSIVQSMKEDKYISDFQLYFLGKSIAHILLKLVTFSFNQNNRIDFSIFSKYSITEDDVVATMIHNLENSTISEEKLDMFLDYLREHSDFEGDQVLSMYTSLICGDNRDVRITDSQLTEKEDNTIQEENLCRSGFDFSFLSEKLEDICDFKKLIKLVGIKYGISLSQEEVDSFYKGLKNNDFDTIVVTGKKVKNNPDIYKNIELHGIFYLELKEKVQDENIGQDDILALIINVSHLNTRALFNTDNLELLVFGDDVKSISSMVSYYTQGLKNIIFLDGVEKIDGIVFNDSSIRNIVFPRSLTSLTHEYNGSSKIENVYLPNDFKINLNVFKADKANIFAYDENYQVSSFAMQNEGGFIKKKGFFQRI